LVVDGRTLVDPRPVLIKVHFRVAGTAPWEVARLDSAVKVFFGWQVEEVEPLTVVFGTRARFDTIPLAALNATVDDVSGRGEGGFDVVGQIDRVRNEISCHYIVHGGLRRLGRHVEPDTSSHGNIAITGHAVGILKQLQLAIVRASGEDIRELTVVVVPRELEGTSTVVLLTGLVGPSIIRPAIVPVVAFRNLFDVIESLGPEFTVRVTSLSSLLAPVSKECGQLAHANLVKGVVI